MYVGNDLYRGSYRRCGEGDYRLTRNEIELMRFEQKNVDNPAENEL